MKEFKDKVAIITGAAHGLGVEYAQEAVRRGMKVVLADIDKKPLLEVEKNLAAMGGDVLAVELDVTEYDQIEMLAQKTLDRFSSVDILFNNAGVGFSGRMWKLPLRDIRYIVESDLMSVVYGMRVFIPIMLEQKTPCHIVNVASAAGLVVSPNADLYHMVKHGVVALTESVSLRMQMDKANIKLSVFCPGFIQTDLHHGNERRPERFKMTGDEAYYKSEDFQIAAASTNFEITNGIAPDIVGQAVFTAIEEEDFYILTHPQLNVLIGMRVKTILDHKVPDASFFIYR